MKRWPLYSLILLSILTFLSRVLGQLSRVFVNGAVLFRGEDPWYNVRLADYFAHNFPHYLLHDYFVNPHGQPVVGWPPLLTTLIGFPGHFLSEYAMQVWAAFLPPVVAVLCVIAFYFLAKQVLHSRFYAFIATTLFAILPTEFYQRTLLGFTDHHMFEVLFTVLALLFLLRLPKRAINAIWLGLSLTGLYLSWAGTAYILFVLSIYIIVYSYYLHYKHKYTLLQTYASRLISAAGIATLGFALSVPFSSSAKANGEMLILFYLIPLGLLFFSHVLCNRKTFYVTTVAIAGTILALLLRFLPIDNIFSGIYHSGPRNLLSESSPISWTYAYSTLGIAAPPAILGFVFYLYKRKGALLVVFTIPMLIATIMQVRYEYYLIIPIAIFVSYFIQQIPLNHKNVIASIVLLFVLMFSLTNIIHLATYQNDISPQMYQALVWMRNNTEQSYTNVIYTPNMSTIPSADLLNAPLNFNASQLVLSWGDYGSWVTYVAHRSPVASPLGDQYAQIMSYFTTGNYTALEQSITKLYGKAIPVKYLLINKQMLTSGWLNYITNSKPSYLQTLWSGQAANYKTIYSNSEVKILEYVR